MASLRNIFDFIVSQNLSVVAVLDNDDLKPIIVGCLLLEVVSKQDPMLPEVFYLIYSIMNNSVDSKHESGLVSCMLYIYVCRCLEMLLLK